MHDEFSRYLEYIGVNYRVPCNKQNSTATALLPESTLDATMDTEQG